MAAPRTARPPVAAGALPLRSGSGPGGNGRWIHVLPAGTVHGRDGRGPYTIADPAAVIRASRERAGRRLIPVDYEHQTDLAPDNGRPAPAAGWIDALQARPDGIWGRVRWTDRAAAHLAALEYRYLSPVFTHASDGSVIALLRASLTNVPNLDQLTALARSETRMKTLPDDEFLSALRTLLSLETDAAPETILAAVEELVTARQSANPDPARFVPIGDFERVVSEANRLNKGMAAREARQHVELQVRNGNMPPMLRDWGVALCSVNRTAFDAFIERTRGAFNALVEPFPHGASPYRKAAADPLSADEQAVCARMGVTADEFAAARSFSRRAEG